MSATAIPDGSEERHKVAANATYEIDALLRMLTRDLSNDDEHGFKLVLRTALLRMRDLNSVAMSVTGGDDGRETSEMQRIVFGDQA